MSDYSSDSEGGVCIGVQARTPEPEVNETSIDRFNRRRRAHEAKNPQRMRRKDDAARDRFAALRKGSDDVARVVPAAAAKDDTRAHAQAREREQGRSRECVVAAAAAKDDTRVHAQPRERGRERERSRERAHRRRRRREHTYSACHVCRADTEDTAPGNIVLCNTCRIPYMVGANDCRLFCARAENMQFAQIVQVAEQRMTEVYNAVFGQQQQQQYDPAAEPPGTYKRRRWRQCITYRSAYLIRSHGSVRRYVRAHTFRRHIKRTCIRALCKFSRH